MIVDKVANDFGNDIKMKEHKFYSVLPYSRPTSQIWIKHQSNNGIFGGLDPSHKSEYQFEYNSVTMFYIETNKYGTSTPIPGQFI